MCDVEPEVLHEGRRHKGSSLVRGSNTTHGDRELVNKCFVYIYYLAMTSAVNIMLPVQHRFIVDRILIIGSSTLYRHGSWKHMLLRVQC